MDESVVIKLTGRIDTNNAKEIEQYIYHMREQSDLNYVVFDMDNLDYISSAGLRILLAFAKKEKNKIKMINMSSTVYEIFQTTGFSEIFDVQKKVRYISTQECKMIGMGGHGKVYRLDDETIVKVYTDGTDYETVQKEKTYAQKAFLAGIPTAIPFDVVRCDEGYGMVFELIDSSILGVQIAKDPQNLDRYARQYTDLLQLLHQTEADVNEYTNIKDEYLKRADILEVEMTKKEKEKMIRLIEAIPDRKTMVHGDFHAGNVMVRDGELMIIDISDISYGHPLFDIGGMYTTHVLASYNEGLTERIARLSPELTRALWDKTIRCYFNTEDSNQVKDISQKLSDFSWLRSFSVNATSSRNLTPEYRKAVIDALKPKLFLVIDKLTESIMSMNPKQIIW